jgi:hypothetical protein
MRSRPGSAICWFTRPGPVSFIIVSKRYSLGPCSASLARHDHHFVTGAWAPVVLHWPAPTSTSELVQSAPSLNPVDPARTAELDHLGPLTVG